MYGAPLEYNQTIQRGVKFFVFQRRAYVYGRFDKNPADIFAEKGRKWGENLTPFETVYVDESDANHVEKKNGKKNDNLGWEIQILCPPL